MDLTLTVKIEEFSLSLERHLQQSQSPCSLFIIKWRERVTFREEPHLIHLGLLHQDEMDSALDCINLMVRSPLI